MAILSTTVPVMTATVGGTTPTPPNDATKFLSGAATYIPAGGLPNWVDEGTLTWSASSADQSLTLANSGKDIYQLIFHIENAGAINMQFNGNSGANYTYNEIGNGATDYATGQTSFAIGTGATQAPLIGIIYVAGHNATNGSLLISGSGSANNTSKFILNGTFGPGGGTISLSSFKILVNATTVTGKVHAYSLNL